MKKFLLLLIVCVFFVGSVNADQWIRDGDSYYIKFEWTDKRPDQDAPGGYVLYDFDLNHLMMTAVRTYRAFNVYAKNGSPDIETGAPIMDHCAWPAWNFGDPEDPLDGYGWDTPDADETWSDGTHYLISLDTFQEKWWLFYVDYPHPSTKGVADIYVPMSGKTKKVEYDEENNTVTIDLEEEGGDWGCYWIWGIESTKLQDKHFVLQLDLDDKVGFIAPKDFFKKPKKEKK